MKEPPFNALAYEIAHMLNDHDALPLYKSFVERYSHQYLRDTLAKVMSIPKEKIKKTRGALFTFLVQNHGRNTRR